jgi:hypothetical protein
LEEFLDFIDKNLKGGSKKSKDKMICDWIK